MEHLTSSELWELLIAKLEKEDDDIQIPVIINKAGK